MHVTYNSQLGLCNQYDQANAKLTVIIQESKLYFVIIIMEFYVLYWINKESQIIFRKISKTFQQWGRCGISDHPKTSISSKNVVLQENFKKTSKTKNLVKWNVNQFHGIFLDVFKFSQSKSLFSWKIILVKKFFSVKL